MNKISPTELSRQMGISKQAIFEAIKNGNIPFILIGNRKIINLDDQGVKAYIQDTSRQREHGKLQSEKLPKKTAKTKKLPTKKKKIAKPAKGSKKSSGKKHKSGILDSLMNLTAHEVKQRDAIASMRKKELDVEFKLKNLLPREFIEDGLFRYITRLNTTLERSASVFVGEIGAKILEAGEITPEHIEKFVGMVLEAIYNTKKDIVREIKKYEPKL